MKKIARQDISIQIDKNNVHQKLLDQLLASSYIRKIISELNIQENELSFANAVGLARVLETKEVCGKCSGLEGCQRSKIVTSIVRYESEIVFEDHSCPALINSLRLQENLVYDNSDFSVVLKDNQEAEAVAQQLFTHKILFLSNEKLEKANQTLHKTLCFLGKNSKVAYIDFPVFIQEMKTAIANFESVDYFISKILTSDYLFITNIGQEKNSEFSRDTLLLPLLQGRNKEQKTLLATPLMELDLSKHFIAKYESYNDFKVERIIKAIKGL